MSKLTYKTITYFKTFDTDDTRVLRCKCESEEEFQEVIKDIPHENIICIKEAIQ